MRLWDTRVDQIAVVGTPPPRTARDWWLAAVLAALVALEVALRFVFDDSASQWLYLSLLPAAVALAVVPFRREHPLSTAISSFFAEGVFEIARRSDELDVDTTFGHGIAGIVLIYAMCRWATPQRITIGLAVFGVCGFAGATAGGGSFASNLNFVAPGVVVAAAALAMRYRDRLGHQQQLQVRLEERHTLARELHDAVAHHVSAIAVQAQAAEFVAATDPAAATAAMNNVVEIANTAIDEMRRMVGVLRSADDEIRSVAPTSLAELENRLSSPRISIVGEYDLSSLTAPIAAAVYRLVQESITNARRHSRSLTFVDVDLAFDENAVRLQVDNDGVPTTRNTGSGYGLIGMRERVDALGGELKAGPRAASGWRVSVQLPYERGSDLVQP